MQFVLTQLTVFCLLAHAILGCCADYWHSPEVRPAAGSSSVSDDADQSQSAHGHSSCRCRHVIEEQNSGGHQDPAQHQCEHDYCQWIASDGGHQNVAMGVLWWLNDCIVTATLSAVNTENDARFDVRPFHSETGDSLRLHLALRVLQV